MSIDILKSRPELFGKKEAMGGDFIGIKSSDIGTSLGLIETTMKGPGKRVLLDTTPYEINGEEHIGQKAVYLNAVQEDASVFLLPATLAVAQHPEFIADVVSQFDIYIGGGGQHFKKIVDRYPELLESAGDYGGISIVRDLTNEITIREILEQLKQGLLICRSAHILEEIMEFEFSASSSHHFSPKNEMVSHRVKSEVEEQLRIPALEGLKVVTSYHNIQTNKNSVQTDLARENYGFIVYHTDVPQSPDQEEAVETGMILDKFGRPRIIAVQHHIERDPTFEGGEAREAIKDLLFAA